MTSPDLTPAPAQDPPAPRNERFKPTKIDKSELLGDMGPVPEPILPTPPVDTPVAPVVEPTVEPTPVDPGLLDNLFAPNDPVPPVVEPVVDPNVTPEPEPTDLPSQLRKQLKEQKKAFEEQTRQSREAADKLSQEANDLRNELQIQNPLMTPQVIEAKESLEVEIGRIAKTMGSPADARKFMETAKTLSDSYSKLGDIYSDGYDERFAQFKQGVEQKYGDSAATLMLAMPRIDELRHSMDVAVQEANSSSVDTHRQRQMMAHEDSTKLFRDAVGQTIAYNERLASIEPFAAQNIIAKMNESVPDFGDTSQQLISSLEQAMTPPRPILPEDAPSLSPEQRNAKEQEIYAAYQQNSQELAKLTPLAFHALKALPVMAQALSDTKERLQAYIKDSPAPGPNHGERVAAPAAQTPGQATPNGKPRLITKEELLGG